VGDSIIAKKIDLDAVERESWSLARRVTKLCKLFWGDKIHMYALNPEELDDGEGNLKRISPKCVENMKSKCLNVSVNFPLLELLLKKVWGLLSLNFMEVIICEVRVPCQELLIPGESRLSLVNLG